MLRNGPSFLVSRQALPRSIRFNSSTPSRLPSKKPTRKTDKVWSPDNERSKVQRLEGVTRKMIDKQRPRNVWEAQKRTGSEEEGKRLRDVIQSQGRSVLGSQEKQMYFKEDPSSSSTDEEDALGGIDVVPGSFIVTRR